MGACRCINGGEGRMFSIDVDDHSIAVVLVALTTSLANVLFCFLFSA